MSRVVVDTSVLVDFLRRHDRETTVLGALVSQADHEFCIALITHTELYAGSSVWERPQARKELEIVLAGLLILPFSLEVSERAGWVRATYRLSPPDAIIAATALEHSLPLLTFDVADFKKIKGLKLFSV